MAKMFAVRDETGVMRAKIPESMALQIVARDDGHWDDYRSKKDPNNTLRVIRVTNELAIDLKVHPLAQEAVKLFFWSGYTLVPE